MMCFYGTCFLGFAKIFGTFLRVVRGEFVGRKCLGSIGTSYFQRGFVICSLLYIQCNCRARELSSHLCGHCEMRVITFLICDRHVY